MLIIIVICFLKLGCYIIVNYYCILEIRFIFKRLYNFGILVKRMNRYIFSCMINIRINIFEERRI